MYKLAKEDGQWVVKHYWDDGATVQVRYFKTKREAERYYSEKTLDS